MDRRRRPRPLRSLALQPGEHRGAARALQLHRLLQPGGRRDHRGRPGHSDQEERKDLYFRFQEILAEEQPYLFAYAPLVRDRMNAGMRWTDGEFNLESPLWLWQRDKIVIPES